MQSSPPLTSTTPEVDLSPGTVVADRFEIVEILGRGAFTCAYLAKDQSRGDSCVLKELRPPGSTRDASGILHLPDEGSEHNLRLRHRFLEDARLSMAVAAPGIIGVRETFADMGTSFYATDFLPNARTLAEELNERGRLEPGVAQRQFRALLASLDAIHAKGVLHRDLRPSNILLSDERAYLIDFGGAREWEADREPSSLRTHAYAAPEQRAEHVRRGPATDLYSLCATYFHAVTGTPPPDPEELAAGKPMPPIRDSNADIPAELAAAIAFGMRPAYADRPQSAASLLKVLEGESASEQADETLAAFDSKALRLQKLRFERRQCPGCGYGVLDEPRPLKLRVCPVCCSGSVKVRKLDVRMCPYCRQAPLARQENEWPRAICPICATGVLSPIRSGLFRKGECVACPECESRFLPEEAKWRLVSWKGRELAPDRQRTQEAEEWRRESRRARVFWECRGCGAQLDELPNGRRKMAVPAHTMRYESLFPEEWARIAANLPPEAGNAECDACGADYFVEGDSVTYLGGGNEIGEGAKKLKGRLLNWEALRWLGVGKESRRDGYVCTDCGTEFDVERDFLQLVQSPNLVLHDRAQTVHTIEDWHRIAQGLPTRAEEPRFELDFDRALVEAYCSGQISLEHPKRPDLLWNGPAERLEATEEGWVVRGDVHLSITTAELVYGGLLKKQKIPLDRIESVEANGEAAIFQVGEEPAPLGFRIIPLEMKAQLESGTRTVELGPAELCRRLALELG